MTKKAQPKTTNGDKTANGDTTKPWNETPEAQFAESSFATSTKSLLRKANGDKFKPWKKRGLQKCKANAANLADITNPQLQLAILARISYEIRHLSADNLSQLTRFIEGEVSYRERARA